MICIYASVLDGSKQAYLIYSNTDEDLTSGVGTS